jgi:3-hydroxyisobutyrate dehydrogenase-like beta-hydroxyacid dehydrogenase
MLTRTHSSWINETAEPLAHTEVTHGRVVQAVTAAECVKASTITIAMLSDPAAAEAVRTARLPRVTLRILSRSQ